MDLAQKYYLFMPRLSKEINAVKVVTDAKMVGGLKSHAALLCYTCLMDCADRVLYLCPSKSELKIIDFSFMPKIIRRLSKDHVP